MTTPGRFTKQVDETFTIAADFSNVLASTESIQAGSSSVTAVDSGGETATATVLSGSPTINDDGDQLRIRVRAGAVASSPYKITFLAVTDAANTFEKDVYMEVVSN